MMPCVYDCPQAGENIADTSGYSSPGHTPQQRPHTPTFGGYPHPDEINKTLRMISGGIGGVGPSGGSPGMSRGM